MSSSTFNPHTVRTKLSSLTCNNAKSLCPEPGGLPLFAELPRRLIIRMHRQRGWVNNRATRPALTLLLPLVACAPLPPERFIVLSSVQGWELRRKRLAASRRIPLLAHVLEKTARWSQCACLERDMKPSKPQVGLCSVEDLFGGTFHQKFISLASYFMQIFRRIG